MIEKFNVDYMPDQTSAPMVAFDTVRLVMGGVMRQDWEMVQLDVSTAYLNAPVHEEIYMQQPPGFEEFSPTGDQLACRLKRSIYCLRQSGFNWHSVFTDFAITEV